MREALARAKFRISPFDNVLTLEETTYLLRDIAAGEQENRPHYEARIGLAVLNDYAKHEFRSLKERDLNKLSYACQIDIIRNIARKRGQITRLRISTGRTRGPFFDSQIEHLQEQIEKESDYARILDKTDEIRDILKILRPGTIRSD